MSQAAFEALLFETAGTRYLTRLDTLDEVLMPVELQTLTGAPPFLRGVMSLRGEVLPVIALAERLGAEVRDAWQRGNRILKVTSGPHAYGVVVDAIGRIQPLDAAAAEAPVLAEQAAVRFLGPLWRVEETLVQEIRLDALLDEEALAQLSRKQPRLAP